MRKKLACVLGALLIAGSVAIVSPTPSLAAQQPTVSMVTLQTMPGQNGQQMVVLPRGKVVPLPGAGVNSSAVNIYMGSQGGYWYVDKTGQNVDLTSAVQYLQRMAAQAGMPVTPPQYAMQPVVNNYYNESGSNNGSGGSSSSSGSSAAGTAVMAGLGAATGAAVTNAIMDSNYNNSYYHGVPYGMPVYYGAHGNPYYTDRNGNNVYVNNSKEYNKNVAASANVTQNTVNNQHINALNEQQKWYQNQAKNHTDTFNNWQQNRAADNPFVHQDAQNQWANRGGDANGDGGRLGRGNDNNGDGGRFGRRNNDGGTTDGGGRFANRANSDSSGGRFGGGDGGGRFGGGDGGGRFGGGGGLRGRRGR